MPKSTNNKKPTHQREQTDPKIVIHLVPAKDEENSNAPYTL